jgi:CDP-paratose 2-epimerase
MYNIGGGRKNSCSVIEAISIIENISKIKMLKKYNKKNRVGDHIWYISSNSKFKKDYKSWDVKYSLKNILKNIITEIKNRM